MALDETIEFSKAIDVAVAMTNESETLIVVTADHAHTMSISGYALRTESIFGFGGDADDHLPYSVLSYANGPGYKTSSDGTRPDPSNDNTGKSLIETEIRNSEYFFQLYLIPFPFSEKYDYKFPAYAPLDSETHGGDDVIVFAKGPWAHLFSGAYEQNFIPHAMG